MKKLLALLLAFMMVFSVATLLAGCDGDSSKESASNKEDKDDEEEKKDDDKPTDPSEPSDPDDPSDPADPTDDGLLTSMSPKFKEENCPNFGIVATAYNGAETIEIQYAYQTISDSEILVYLTNPDGEWMYRIKQEGDNIVYNRYLITDGSWYEDVTSTTIEKANEFNSIQSHFDIFTAVGYGHKFKNIGTENHELGTLNIFEIYDGEELKGTAKVHATYGVIVELKLASGEVTQAISEIYTELDLEDFLENGYGTPETPPENNDDEFESDIDTDFVIDPNEGGIVGDFDINFG